MCVCVCVCTCVYVCMCVSILKDKYPNFEVGLKCIIMVF